MSQSNLKEDVKIFEHLMSSTDSFMLSRSRHYSTHENENIPSQNVWGQPSRHQKMS